MKGAYTGDEPNPSQIPLDVPGMSKIAKVFSEHLLYKHRHQYEYMVHCSSAYNAALDWTHMLEKLQKRWRKYVVLEYINWPKMLYAEGALALGENARKLTSI